MNSNRRCAELGKPLSLIKVSCNTEGYCMCMSGCACVLVCVCVLGFYDQAGLQQYFDGQDASKLPLKRESV